MFARPRKAVKPKDQDQQKVIKINALLTPPKNPFQTRSLFTDLFMSRTSEPTSHSSITKNPKTPENVGIAITKKSFYEGQIANPPRNFTGVGYLINMGEFDFFGELRSGLRSGVGVQRTPSFKKMGNFLNDEIHGYGKFLLKENSSQLKACFVKGNPEGYVELHQPEDEKLVKGYVKNGKFQGFCQVLKNQETYLGEILIGQKKRSWVDNRARL